MKGITELTHNDILLITILALVVLVVVTILLIGGFLIDSLNKLLQKEQIKRGLKPESFLSHFFKGWTDAVPLEKEESIILDHDYDGIRELDNHLPPWWKWLFYVCVVFAIVYMVDYHVLKSSPLMEEEYKIEVQKAEIAVAEYRKKAANSIDENNVKELTDKAIIEEGQKIFITNCKTCHGENAQGTAAAPNLTDEYWLHGGSINDVFKTIKYGVQAKGMIPWQEKLRPSEIQSVANYILSVQGSNPANAREPQGEKFERKKQE